jgi:hypothetical protein
VISWLPQILLIIVPRLIFLQIDLPRITGAMKIGSTCSSQGVYMILRQIGILMHIGIDKEMEIGSSKT